MTIKDNRQYAEINGIKYIIAEKDTKVKSILDDIEINLTGCTLVIKDAESRKLSDTDLVKTNQSIEIEGSEQKVDMIVIIKGDINSDGKVDFKDISKLNNYRINSNKANSSWSDAEKIAFKSLKSINISETAINKISYSDIAILNNQRLK